MGSFDCSSMARRYALAARPARGYHRRPDLDAIAFAADPLRPGNGSYRTATSASAAPTDALNHRAQGSQIKLAASASSLAK
jgi:non-ribosomal peptide synthetase component F